MTNILKAALIDEPKETIEMNQKETKALVDGFLEQLTQHLKAGDKVQLTSFGASNSENGAHARVSTQQPKQSSRFRQASILRLGRVKALKMRSTNALSCLNSQAPCAVNASTARAT